MRPVIGLIAAAMVLVGGSNAKRVDTPTFDPTPTGTTTPFPTLPTGPMAPVKYTKAALKTCLDIKQEVGGDLPPPQPDTFQKIGNQSSRSCIFKTGELAVVYGFSSWEKTDNAAGVRAGAEYANKYFTERAQSWEQDSGVSVGSDARWRDKSTAACGLEILDENGVLTVARSSGTAVGFDEEQCRTAVRELAKKFFAAVQP